MRKPRTFPEARLCGAVLRQARLQRGLTTTDLALATGYSQQLVSAIELGQRNAPLGTWTTLARALDVPLGQLVEALDLPACAALAEP